MKNKSKLEIFIAIPGGQIIGKAKGKFAIVATIFAIFMTLFVMVVLSLRFNL
jgi:hypothetical protein